jgi:hypothetical protein
MKLVIYTQFEENYGAHDWDGEGACPQYWKPKGGDVYVVENLEWADHLGSDIRNNICSILNKSDDYTRQWVISSSFEDNDSFPWSEWDDPIYLDRAENGYWLARQVKSGDACGFHRSIKQTISEWVMLPNGRRDNFTTLYVTDRGALTYDEWKAEYGDDKVHALDRSV